MSAWIDPDDPQEVNTGGADITVNVGSWENVTLDKIYGPLAADPLKVYVDSWAGEWVVEVWNEIDGEWVEKVRWDCQEQMPEGED